MLEMKTWEKYIFLKFFFSSCGRNFLPYHTQFYFVRQAEDIYIVWL